MSTSKQESSTRQACRRGERGSQEQKKAGGAADEGGQHGPAAEHPCIRKTGRLGAGAASGAEAAAVGKSKSRSTRRLDWASLLHYGREGRMGAAAATAGRAFLLQVTALCTVLLFSNKIRWQWGTTQTDISIHFY